MARITVIKDRIRQMNPASFQIMCDAYMSKKGYKNIVALGTMAGAEKTTSGTPDTYVSFTDGKYVFIEYTTKQEGIAGKIKEDLVKCLDESKTGITYDLISEIIYIYNSSNLLPKDDHALKEFCKSYGIPLKIIGIDELAPDLMYHFPSILYDHLRISFDTKQVQGIEDFIDQYDNNKTAAPLSTSFLFREIEMEQVSEKLTAVDVVVVTAPAGTGKTRFALEYARKHAQDHDEQIVCIHDQGLEIYNDMCMTFEDPGSYFVIIDDANQLSNLSNILSLFNSLSEDHTYKILITVREYAKEIVRDVLEKNTKYDTIELHALTDDEIRELVRQHFGILNQKYLDRIAEISDGNPRIAMLAGKTAKETDEFDSIKDVTALYDAYYGAALSESGISEDSTRLICAGVVAFLGIIHLDHIGPIYQMLKTKGITEDEFRHEMHNLHSAELVDICHNTAVRISDQCLADYVLKYVFYDKKLIRLGEMILTCLKPYHGHTMRAINALYGKYQSDEMHSFLDEEIKKVWNQLKDEKSDMFWDFVKSFFPVNPLDTLLILKKRINNAECVSIPISQIDTEKGKNNVSITDDYISILGGFNRITNLDAALDLFFTYYLKRPDLYMQFYHASCTFFGIKPNSHEIGYYRQLHYIHKIIQYSENWNNDYIVILFLEVMQEFLKLHFEPTENGRHNTIVMYQIPLFPSEAATNYRNLAWSQLITIAQMGKYPDRFREMLKNYGRRTEESSFEVAKGDAPYLFQIIDLILSTDCLLDCLLVKDLSKRLVRAGVDTSILMPYLSGAKMERYHILAGPNWRDGIDFDEMQKIHRQNIAACFANSDDKVKVFNDLYNIYRELTSQNHSVIAGIRYALQELSSDPSGFISVSEKILSHVDSDGIGLSNIIVHILFQFLKPNEVKHTIQSHASSQQDVWMYAYFEEMPKEKIDGEIVQELYEFLQKEQLDPSKGIPMRDYRFFDKYSAVDSKVLVNATEIIFAKRMQQPYLVICYFEWMFTDKKDPSLIINAYADNVCLLCDLYIFLFVAGHNLDDDGIYLCELMEKNHGMVEKLADAIIDFKRQNRYTDIDSRFCALFYTEQFIETISCIADRIIELTEYPSLYASDTLSVFFMIPQERPDIVALQRQWVTSYIWQNSTDIEKMECIFSAVANHSFAMMKDCVAAFIECNKDFDAFKALTITPTSYGGWGSFVPHYNNCIMVLKSLLPLFTDIETIQHKLAVEKQIERYRRQIKEEEISNIIEG